MRSLFVSCLALLVLSGCQTAPIASISPYPADIPSKSAQQPDAKSVAAKVPDDSYRIPFIDLTTQPDNLWQRVRNGFAMPDLDNPLVAERQAWYLNRPDFLRTLFNRSRRYLHHIVTELDKRGMPTELALLPLVESAYNPQARSPASAEGLWQFIPSTGRNYNLEQNAWLDERRDIIASTNAALDYLRYIYEMHGDWQLALASYNWGEGAVGRAIAKNKTLGLPTDYARLSMPAETRHYVPKLQALKNIVANPALFNFKLDPIPNQPYFQVIERTGDMDVAIAARLAEIPITEFLALNPAYKRPVMPESAKSPLVIPSDKVKRFIDNLAAHEAQDKPLATWRTHTLGSNESLADVAGEYGISTAYLKKINGLGRRAKTYSGLGLLVPAKGVVVTDDMLAAAKEEEEEAPPARETRKSRRGAKENKKGSNKKGRLARQNKKFKGKSAGANNIKTSKRGAKTLLPRKNESLCAFATLHQANPAKKTPTKNPLKTARKNAN
ncbi:MAG TPA: transglycosylase SLT domain-containing protein [Rugosibacter sp.]|nr:transglycosylase SLT domain-containing protein [Rugosibacter sp.]